MVGNLAGGRGRYVVPNWVVGVVMSRSGVPGGWGLYGCYGHGGHDGVLMRWDSRSRGSLPLPGMLPFSVLLAGPPMTLRIGDGLPGLPLPRALRSQVAGFSLG
jgi:hypothetical protein